jgi:hypothetical protein
MTAARIGDLRATGGISDHGAFERPSVELVVNQALYLGGRTAPFSAVLVQVGGQPRKII